MILSSALKHHAHAVFGAKEPYVDQLALDACTREYFGVTLNSFRPSSRGQNGSFTGTGPSYLPNNSIPGNKQSFTITNNVTSYSTSYLKFKDDEFRKAAGRPPNATNVTIDGLTMPGSPLTNYTGNNVTNPMKILIIQIHELGHSLDDITKIGYDDRERFPVHPDDLGGTILENCVKRRGGFKYR